MTREEKKRMKELERKFNKGTTTSDENLELVELYNKDTKRLNNITLRNQKIAVWILIGTVILMIIDAIR